MISRIRLLISWLLFIVAMQSVVCAVFVGPVQLTYEGCALISMGIFLVEKVHICFCTHFIVCC